MHNVCLGKEPKLDGMVQFAIATQRAADKEMKSVLDRQPRPEAPLHTAAVLEEARDAIVRFGSHLDSHKGRPFDTRLFFQNEAPSVLARRRMTKLTAAVGKILEEVERHKDKIREVKVWKEDLIDVHKKLLVVEKHQRATKVEKLDLAPDVAAARLVWLAKYNANKFLIRGLLSHLGKVELMPLIFDDLAE